MNTFNLFCLLFGIFGLIVLKFRVHIHVTCQSSTRSNRAGYVGPIQQREEQRGAPRSSQPSRCTDGERGGRRDTCPTALSSLRGREPRRAAITSSGRTGEDRPHQFSEARRVSLRRTADTQAAIGEPSKQVVSADFNLTELSSALVNLGCKPAKARQIASKVYQPGAEFDSMLRQALQEAA